MTLRPRAHTAGTSRAEAQGRVIDDKPTDPEQMIVADPRYCHLRVYSHALRLAESGLPERPFSSNPTPMRFDVEARRAAVISDKHSDRAWSRTPRFRMRAEDLGARPSAAF